MEQKGGRPPLWALYFTALGYGAVGLFWLWLSHRRHGIPWSDLLGLGHPWQVFGWGTILAVVLIGFEMAIATFVPDRLWADDGRNASFCELGYGHIFLLMLVVGVGEELFFRAGIQRLLVEGLGSAVEGILLASIVFALLHPYWKKPLLMVSVFAMGAVMGWGYWFTGSIWTSAWCHFLVNFVMTLFGKKGMFLPRRSADEP
ncbi:MAG: CPBP family intramembrane metalloprotease [Kyrpidia tusciae]|nr:type II CAAX endopeptidase family protein [Kyrpidia tusciae]MBE3552558.1 CPBP family intramembrane metalloprotease [Kyrpidia tusciae]